MVMQGPVNVAWGGRTKGKGQSVPQALEGQVIVVQVADLMQTRRSFLIWQPGCFGLYATVLLKKRTGKFSELIAYMTTLQRPV